MKKHLNSNRGDLKRRKRELLIISIILPIIILLTYFGTRIFNIGVDLPITDSILVFALLNINVILLLILLYLTIRNIVKLILERKGETLGIGLRPKLVFAFLILSLLPAVIIFSVSVQFISLSTDYWFSVNIEQSLQKSIEVGQDYYNRIGNELLSFGNNLSSLITYKGYIDLHDSDKLQSLIEQKRREYNLDSIRIFSSDLRPRAVSYNNMVNLKSFKDLDIEKLYKSFKYSTDMLEIEKSSHGDLVRGIVPIFSQSETKSQAGSIVLAKYIPEIIANKLTTVEKGIQGYTELKSLKKPIKASHLFALSIVTLLVIFSAVWFGFYLSKGITVPMEELAIATTRIASGDYNFHIDSKSRDEMGVLIDSFNRMTKDLRESKYNLDSVNKDLIKSKRESDQRRLYMETILQNVAAGVISANSRGVISTINKSAEKMLNISAKEIIGKRYQDVLGPKYLPILSGILSEKNIFQKGIIQREIGISVKRRYLKLLISLNLLRDNQGNYLGVVAVFEDLTELERVQRVAAWREVARRIAHEVKNPLTPIQLSAQRLRRKYGEKLAQENGKVFDECTRSIINSVEELRVLVNEFSNFARMPAPKLETANIKFIIQDAMLLYKETYKKNILFKFIEHDEIPAFPVDKEQIKRVMINLLDNAVASISGKGRITVVLSHEKSSGVVRIEVEDTGSGISEKDKERLFEPYFSTKKSGTGLGLAIVSKILDDHNALIRVEDNSPGGTKFIIELPVKGLKKSIVTG